MSHDREPPARGAPRPPARPVPADILLDPRSDPPARPVPAAILAPRDDPPARPVPADILAPRDDPPARPVPTAILAPGDAPPARHVPADILAPGDDPPADAPVAADMFDAPWLRLVPHPPSLPAIAPPQALAELDALLARDVRDDVALARLAALAPLVPGRLRAVVAALAASDSPAALAALLTVPDAPGALQAACRALVAGRTRRLSPTPGEPGPLAPVCCALEFRPSRARPFPDLLRRAQRLADDPSGALRLDALRADGRVRYRLSFWPEQLDPRPRAALARAATADLVLLHARLSRLRGARLWLNGFCLDDDGPVSPAAQAHLLRAWLTWAEGHAR